MDHEKHRLFLKLLLEHQSKVHAYILTLVPNYADADDILQDVSQFLWQRFDDFQPGTNFLAWALRCAYIEILSFRKRRAKSKETVFDEQILERMLPVLDDEMSRIDVRLGALERCLGTLEDRGRELIKLRYSQGLRPKEMSLRLGYSLANIYKKLSRLHGKLLSCVERRMRAEGYSYG